MGERLGQYFLKNKSAVRKIINSLKLTPGDTVVEIGPGRGELTIPLAKKCDEVGCKIIAIEKDKKLIEILRNSIEIYSDRIHFIEGDILKILNNLISNLSPFTPWKLVGNIPYYITGRLLRILSELEHKPELTVLTIQKEVAERIVARPPKLKLLAAITQFWASPKIIARLKPKHFKPQPKVDSAIISIARTNADPTRTDAEKYYKFVRILFKQPRKTILNNLRSALPLEAEKIIKILKKHGLSGKERPQNLNLDLLIKLAREFGK